ncbi:MAG: hypothetical protein WCS65_15335 [Verrucomicrobiae bacterium]
MNSSSRVIKTKVPARIIVSATLIGLFVAGFIIVAVWQSGARISDAKMSGIIVTKEFLPFADSEREITLNRSGTVSARNVDGDYIIVVEVPQKDGKKKAVKVWLNDKSRYDAVKVGDTFDVGPYYVRSE